MLFRSEQDLPPVRWWHEWLCGCGEGPDRGGDHQVRLYSLRGLRAFRRTLIVLCYGNRPGARIRLSDRIVMLLRLRLWPFLSSTCLPGYGPFRIRQSRLLCALVDVASTQLISLSLPVSLHHDTDKLLLVFPPPRSHSCGQYGISIA